MRKREEAMPCKVLVVDDEKDILEEAAEALTEEGYECFPASNVDDALAILKGDPEITLVVTDLKMPGKTGGDLIEEARAAFDRDIQFIVMSGHVSPTAKTNGIDIEEFPFLRKPLDIGEFLEMVERVAASIGDMPDDGRGANDE